MIRLVLRRAVAQLPLLAAVLAVVTIGATLLGVCALLLTTTQDRALEVGLARAGPAAADVTAFVGGVRAGDAGSVAATTRAVTAGALAPLPVTTSTRASSAMRALGPQREGDRRLAYLAGVDDLPARARLITGRWPVGGAAVTEAVVLESTARVLGVPMALAERAARRSRSLVLPLAAFEAARRPRAVAASLLLTLAAAAGTFGLAYGATWQRSQQDQADVRVGTDLAVTLVAPAVAGQGAAATGGVVSPVTDRTAVVGEVVGGTVPRLIAVDTTRAGALLRGRLPAGTDWGRVGAPLRPAAAVAGIAVPAGDPALTLTGTLRPGTRVTPQLLLQDRAGVRTPCAAGAVPLDGRPHALRLCEALGPGLRVVGVALRVEQDPGTEPLSGSARLSVALGVPGAAGADPWAATSVGVDAGQLSSPAATVSGSGVVRTTATVELRDLAFEPADVVATAFRPPGPVPVAVSARLARTLGVAAGSPLSVTVGSTPVAMVVAEVAPALPSVPDGPALLADVDLLSRALISTGTYEPVVDGWWVGSPAHPEAAAGLGIGRVVTRAEVAADLAGGPLRVGLPAALAVLVPAAVLLALAGTVLHVTADIGSRAVEVARLRGLGLSRRAVLGGLLAQHGGVLVLLLGAGGLVGALASRVIVPLLVRSETGAAPVPAALPRWPWSGEAALLGLLVLTCAGAIALVLILQARRTHPAALRTTP